MNKTITIRVSAEEYQQISTVAKSEHRPISNFMLHATMNTIANMFTGDNQEMKEILEDKDLVGRMERGQNEARQGKGKIIA